MIHASIFRRAGPLALACLLLSAAALAGQPPASLPAPLADAVEHTVQADDRITFHDGSSMDYTSTAGKLLIRDDANEPIAEIFYVSYTRKGAGIEKRPVTFLWDGGPGASTTATNYLGFGPLRYSPARQNQPLAPYKLAPNEYSLLAHSDLVFLDPVGTGYSQAVGKAKNSDFWGVDADADAMSRAVLRYLDKQGRWQSPKFILGLSYGTARAAVMSNMLQTRGVALNGVVLAASILNFGVFGTGLDHQYLVNLPTMAATAWHHGKTAHQSKSLPDFMDEVRKFAQDDYAKALYQGNALPEATRDDVARRLSEYIGLSPDYLRKAHLRVSVVRFRKALLRDEGKVIGRMDGRALMADFDSAGEEPESDYWLFSEYLLPVNAAMRDNISIKYYEAGHGLFMDDEALPLISKDLARFYARATGRKQAAAKK